MSDLFDRQCYPSKLEKEVTEFVKKIEESVSKLTNRKFHLEVDIKKDLLEGNQSGFQYGDDDTSTACSTCQVDCNKVFLTESISNLKYLSEFFDKVLEKKHHDTSDTSKMGVSEVLNSLIDISGSFSLQDGESFGLEVGGGGGAGFQLFCDDQKILSCGGGGGGGLYYNYNVSSDVHTKTMINIGGGGGAGLQLFDSADQQWHDIGGGGGCGGISVGSDGFPVEMTCGYKKDKYSMSDNDLKDLMKSDFGHDRFDKCSSITVQGGGGGGGGSALCCAPYSLGFGFSFTLQSKDKDVPVVNNNRMLKDVNGTNISNQLFAQSAVECTAARDNWCCICSMTEDYVNHCLNPSYKPDMVFTDVTVSCDEVKANENSIAWMEQMDCCTYYNTTMYASHVANKGTFDSFSQPITQKFASQSSESQSEYDSKYWKMNAYNSWDSNTIDYLNDTKHNVNFYIYEYELLPTEIFKKSNTFMQCFNSENTACMTSFNDTSISLYAKQLQASVGLVSPVRNYMGAFALVAFVVTGFLVLSRMLRKTPMKSFSSNVTEKHVELYTFDTSEYQTIEFYGSTGEEECENA